MIGCPGRAVSNEVAPRRFPGSALTAGGQPEPPCETYGPEQVSYLGPKEYPQGDRLGGIITDGNCVVKKKIIDCWHPPRPEGRGLPRHSGQNVL